MRKKRPPKQLPDGMIRRPGRKAYYADFTVGRKRYRDLLAEDFEAACEILTELQARAAKARHGIRDNHYSLDRLREQYLAHCKQALDPETVSCYTHWLKTVLGGLAVSKVSQLTIGGVTAYRQARLEQGRAARTINGEVGSLKTMIEWGVRAGLLANNPLADVAPLPDRRPKQSRPLTTNEVPKLLAASHPHWRDIWYAFLVTGLRRSELAGLQLTSEFLDWPARELVVPAWLAKTGVERRIPMDPGLQEILRRQEEAAGARQPGRGHGRVSDAQVQARLTRTHVFTSRENTPLEQKGTLWRAFQRCLKRAGIARKTKAPDGRLLEHLTLHSLRKTFCTSLIVAGADPKTVQELMGHRTLTMTMSIYTKVRSGTKHEALARLPYSQVPGPILSLPPVTSGQNATQEQAG